MYTQRFGLTQEPFSIAPDPRFLFMSERHREALAHLLYGVKGGGGFVLLTGAVGAGKTTVCRCFLRQLPEGCDVAYIFNPKLSVVELLQTVCDEFHVETPPAASAKALVDALNVFLLRNHAAGRSSVLIIDEAQNLAPELLEQLRLLTNLETDTHKLLQIVLIGQPELRQRLAEPGLEQLAQRVIARYHLEPLSADETPEYVRHRLSVAGLAAGMPFDAAALKRIHRHARGVPRRINLLCDRSLLGAYAEGRSEVSVPMVDRAAREVFAESGAGVGRWAPSRTVVAALALAGGAALAWLALRGAPPASPTVAATPSVARAAPAPAPARAASAAPTDAPAAAPRDVVLPPRVDAATLAARASSLWPDDAGAWRALGAAWQQPAGADVPDPCRGFAEAGVACHQRELTLAQVRQLDRPGWLTLQADGGRAGRALLTGLGPQDATLQLPDGPVRVSLATLATLWQGDYATLWRTPPGWAGDAGALRGDGPLARWLLAQLGAYQAGALPLDVPLRVRVEAFQRAQGLQPDGMAGPLTLMQLNRALGIDEPHLVASAERAPGR
ncbi:MAG: AAA family ATPase [Rubrivivax sp.]